MPSIKNPPVSDLSALLKGLNKARVQFILVGGLAAVVQGAPVTTFDLDIVPRQSEKNLGYDELLSSTVEIDFKGYKIQVLDLETMVAIKRTATDPSEQYRLKIYEETLRLRDKMGSR